MNTNHSFPEGEGGYSNTISEYQDKASRAHVHVSFGIEDTLEFWHPKSHHRNYTPQPPYPEKSFHWYFRHHTPKGKKPNQILIYYQFSFMI